MAKQDLVVKLLLDSGAFGTDIREAERKAKDFSDNMKNAGKSAGDFGKEVGLSAGALGKLGGVLTGAGAVVAAVGAFKSIMESTNATSIKFNSTISGFQGVLNTFQRSLANFDFTTWLNGMDEVFERHKEWKKLQMDLEINEIATNALISREEAKVKELEIRYKNAATSKEREKYKKEALAVVAKMQNYTANFSGAVNAEFLAAVQALDAGKLKKGSISVKRAEELLWQALEKYNYGTYTTDTAAYDKVAKQIADLTSKIDAASKSQYNSSLAIGRGGDIDTYMSEIERARNEVSTYTAQRQKIINDNQELFFLNAIYTMVADQLNTEVTNMLNAVAQGKKADDILLQVQGWSAPSSGGTGGTGGSTGGKKPATVSTKPEPVAGSLAAMEKLLAELKRVRDEEVVFGSDAWMELTASINETQIALNSMLETQKKYDLVKKESLEVKNVASIGYIQEQISWLEQLRNTLTVGSVEWMEASDVIDAYKEELAELVKIQTDWDAQYTTNTENTTTKFKDMNLAISSSISLLNSLGNAFADSDSAASKAMGSILGMMSSVANGILEFVQIQQAAAAASGTASAAAMPYPYNLAAIASVMATVISVFSNIKSMVGGKFAEGGIVGGTSYSGDKLFAMVNSGEMILNKRQQRNLGNMLGGGGQVEFVISGDSLVGVLNNKNRKTNLTR